MEIIKAEDSHTIESAKSCIATEYPTTSEDINIARVKILGRFPESGVMWNTAVEEIVYVESGDGRVVIDAVETEIKTGDVVLYQKGEKVFWEGEMILLIACTPAWKQEQHAVEE
jgi:mannose-6-phosphate isomerase-like protein (cupin superfamily)